MKHFAFSLTFALLAGAGVAPAADVDFVKDMKPFFELNCVACHREGYARSYLCINGVWQDHLLYAQLADDAK